MEDGINDGSRVMTVRDTIPRFYRVRGTIQMSRNRTLLWFPPMVLSHSKSSDRYSFSKELGLYSPPAPKPVVVVVGHVSKDPNPPCLKTLFVPQCGDRVFRLTGTCLSDSGPVFPGKDSTRSLEKYPLLSSSKLKTF